MVDAVMTGTRAEAGPRKRGGLHKAMQRKSTIAFLMALPLILLILLLVLYPALYSIHLATLNKSMERFVGFDNFLFLFKRETFWMVVQQSCIFAITAVSAKMQDCRTTCQKVSRLNRNRKLSKPTKRCIDLLSVARCIE